jgi:dolichol-phosphate mannosyltransferase
MNTQFDTSKWQVPTHDIHTFNPRTTKYCVCIPIINEGERIRTQLQHMQDIGTPQHTDVIICDGGSTDGSTNHDFLKSVNVRTLLVKTGPGILSAQLRMGYAYALQQGYQGIVTIDGNNKDNPEAIPDFIRELENGYAYVQGSRFVPGGQAINTPMSRYWAIRLIHAPVISLGARRWYTDTTNGYRGYSREMLLDERVQPFRDIFDTYELLAYLSTRPSELGYNTKEIPVVRRYPEQGKIPTKIKGLSGNLSLIKILLATLSGQYKP